MPRAADIKRLSGRRGARGTPEQRAAGAEHSTPRRVWAAFIGVALTYLLALVITVPIGRGAVALTIAFAFLLATVVARRMSS